MNDKILNARRMAQSVADGKTSYLPIDNSHLENLHEWNGDKDYFRGRGTEGVHTELDRLESEGADVGLKRSALSNVYKRSARAGAAEAGSAVKGISGYEALTGLFKSGVAGKAGYGALMGFGAAAIGTMAYGYGNAILPNNVELNSPGHRLAQGIVGGAAVGGALGIARNAESIVGTMASKPAWLESVAKSMTSAVKPGTRTGVIGLGLAAAFAAGSGSFKYHRTVNPIDAV